MFAVCNVDYIVDISSISRIPFLEASRNLLKTTCFLEISTRFFSRRIAVDTGMSF